VAKFGTELGGITHASATLQGTLSMGPDVFPQVGCRSSSIDGDAAGNTFLAIAWNATGIPSYLATSPDAVEKHDDTGALSWELPPPPQPMPPLQEGVTATTVATDGVGGVYLAAMGKLDFGCGSFADPFLMRFDPSGACVWSLATASLATANLGEGPFFGGRLLPTEGGQIYVTASFQGTVDLGCGPMVGASGGSTYVAKLDTCGACLWSRSFASPTLDVELFPGGDLLLSASYAGALDLGGGPLPSAGATSVAVGRVSASGSTLWSRSLGGAGASVAWAEAAADATGGAELVLTVTGTVDLGGGAVGGGVLLKLDATGAFRWQYAPFTGRVAPDPCGAVIAASDCTSCAPGSGWGVSVVKLAP
jgi:hypothetical protein